MRTLYVALIIAAFGAVYLGLAFNIPTPSTGYAFVGPRAFPIFIGLGIIASALWIWHSEPGLVVQRVRLTRFAIAAGMFGLYALTFETAGFLVTTIPMMILVSRLLDSRSLLRDAITAAGLALTIYLIFQTVLHKPLPHGWLG